MKNNLLIDTNIFIYAIDEDSQFHEKAINLLSNPEYFFYTTSKNISECLVVLTKDNNLNISPSECLEIINILLSDITVIFPNQLSLKIFQELIYKYNPRGLWIHDLEIASISLAHGINTIVTQNIDDFKKIKEIDVKSL